MTPKEVLYVEDALAHSQFLQQQFQDAANSLQDPNLKQLSQQLADKAGETFRQFYSLV